MAKWHVGNQIIDQLTEKFEFTFADVFGYYYRVVDDQHAVMVWVKPHKMPASAQSGGVVFGLARRDINELWFDIISGESGDWRTRMTLLENRRMPFLGQPEGNWLNFTNEPHEVDEWMDAWIPRLPEIASLEFIEHYWNRVLAEDERLADEAGDPEIAAKARRQPMVSLPRMMNRLLEGDWDDADQAEFIEPRITQLERLGLDHRATPNLRGQLDRILAFRAAHPDGQPRDLRSGLAT